jgi:uncharacterized protein involved in tolerance to divalent cations
VVIKRRQRGNPFLHRAKTAREYSGDQWRDKRELHSYDLPEVIILPISDGSAEYLNWIVGEVVASG